LWVKCHTQDGFSYLLNILDGRVFWIKVTSDYIATPQHDNSEFDVRTNFWFDCWRTLKC